MKENEFRYFVIRALLTLLKNLMNPNSLRPETAKELSDLQHELEAAREEAMK